MKIKYTAVALLASLFALNVDAQQQLTKEQILAMSMEELSELSLEDLMQAVETLGVSSVDELFNLIMNKNVSSASKKEESSFTSPLSSTVITRDEMRTYGISNIEEAFRLIPGMIVTEKANGVYDVQMRGLNNIPDNNMYLYTENANTLLMIDGRPVQNYVMGSINFDFLPISIEDVERIEVVRGACGALYGANAVAGVINIITERPSAGSKTVSGNLQLGSQGTYVSDFAIRKAFNDKFAAGLTFGMQHRERPTDKLYVIPGQAGLYYCSNQSAMPSAGAQVTTPYSYGSLGSDGVLKLNGVGSIQLDAQGNPVMSTLSLEEGKTAADFQTAITKFKTSYAQHQQIFGGITSASEGGYYSVDEIDDFKQIYPEEYDENGNILSYRLFDAKEPETLGKDMFPSPELSRKQVAFNAYLSFTPASDIMFNLSAGYQNSLSMATPVGDDIFSFNTRTSKTYHIALESEIRGVHVLANYHGGSQNYALNVPGFKAGIDEINVSADYDCNIGGLSIRPGVSYQYLKYVDYLPEWTDESTYSWHYEKPGYEYSEVKYDNMSGFLLDHEGILKTFAPSIKLDYKIGGVRLIGAYRADKTNIPDKWHHSWQFATNYSINDNNFVRFVYGRANRGTNLVNAVADFDWTRTNMVYPKKLHFEANQTADFANIDNFELGYRVKPSSKVLVDAELFYSISSDYGALMASSGAMHVKGDNASRIASVMKSGLAIYEEMYGGKENLAAAVAADPTMIATALHKMITGKGDSYESEGFDLGLVLEPYAGIKYSSLPYKVKQMGISFNVDYIISSKLIAKMNANFQKTTIDNYYVYNQTEDIQSMLTGSKELAVNDLTGDFTQIFKDYLFNGRSMDDAFATVLGARYDAVDDCYSFGVTNITHDDSSTPKSSGVKHEATPAFYGMLGLIYKPLQQVEVAAFANFIGQRTYKLKYGAAELGNRCTVNMKIGYKPVQSFEVFFNAHNLLNTKAREFAHCDEIEGIYSFGVNFGF